MDAALGLSMKSRESVPLEATADEIASQYGKKSLAEDFGVADAWLVLRSV
jgi:hypothetical protein